MAENKATKPTRYSTSPKITGFAHNSFFDNNGVSAEPINAADLKRLQDGFPGVTFAAVEDEPAETPAQ